MMTFLNKFVESVDSSDINGSFFIRFAMLLDCSREIEIDKFFILMLLNCQREIIHHSTSPEQLHSAKSEYPPS